MDADRRSDGRGTILVAHLGRSANCSSVGSLVDFLFASTAVTGAALAALAVLLDGGAPRPSGGADAARGPASAPPAGSEPPARGTDRGGR